MLSHTEIKPYRCETCHQSFQSKWTLQTHIHRIHFDIRKYECTICNKKFRDISHMKNHIYTHTDNQFECDICHQKYRSPRTLKKHKDTVHSSEFPFCCDMCGRKFNRKDHMIVSKICLFLISKTTKIIKIPVE